MYILYLRILNLLLEEKKRVAKVERTKLKSKLEHIKVSVHFVGSCYLTGSTTPVQVTRVFCLFSFFSNSTMLVYLSKGTAL